MPRPGYWNAHSDRDYEDPLGLNERARAEPLRQAWGGIAASPDTRFVDCDHCGGDGGWESAPHGYNPLNGDPLTRWTECPSCGGSGEMEIVVEPIDMEDLPS